MERESKRSPSVSDYSDESSELNLSSSEDSEEINDVGFNVGDRVSGKWSGTQNNGEWYSGTIKSINTVDRTVHIKYDDDDSYECLSWGDMILLDP